MATAASSSSVSNSRLRRKSRTHPHPHRDESEAADVAAPPPFPVVQSSPLPLQLPLQPESADRQEVVESDAAVVKEKKSAWNKPSSNGVIEVVGPVMGAAAWPALSESTKTSPNDPPPTITTISTTTPDGSVSTPGPVVANPPPSKPTVSIPNSNSSVNHAPFRQKSMKKGGNSSSSINNTGALSNGRSVPPSPPATSETHKMAYDKPMSPYKSPREPPSRNSGNWDHGPNRYNNGFSSPNGGNEHPRSYGVHRNNSWNNSRSFTNRDVQMQQPPHQQRLSPRPFPIQVTASGPMPFIGPSPAVRPFGSPMGFPDMSAPLVYIPAPFVAPSPFFFQSPETQLPNVLLKQIEYYFSFDNLCKDVFLRQNMDDEGWVSVSIIANFNRVKRLTHDIGFILNTVQTSSVVEVQGEKLRKRNDWMNWLLPPPVNNQSGSAATSDLSSRLESVGLEEGGNGNSLSVVGPECGP